MRSGNPAPATRHHDLDALRAWAMLLGIALHCAISFCPWFPWPVQDERQSGAFSTFFFAVHGFRMPLFFLLSGFFTAMLWRKRGLTALLRHRFQRVFLPLLLGCLTIIPAVNWSIRYVSDGGGRASDDSRIHMAAKRGDLEQVRQLLDEGIDVNSRDGVPYTPLHWSATTGQIPVSVLLITKGANLEARDGVGSTPLHCAAFFGQTEIVQILLESGANPEPQDQGRRTPLGLVSEEWSKTISTITAVIADALDIKVDLDAIRKARPRIAALLRGEDPELVEQPTGDSKEGERVVTAENTFADFATDPYFFHHLWFLWFLCWLCAGFAFYALVAERLNWKELPAWLTLSPVRFFWLVPLTMVPQAVMRGFEMPAEFGPNTSSGIIPTPHILLYYTIFFIFGALYYDSRDADDRVGRWWFLTLPLALLLVLPQGLEATFGGADLHLRAVFLQVLYAWMMTFGFMGLFRAVLKRERGWVRYVSDASYWMYIAQMPLVFIGQDFMRDVGYPAGVKFALLFCGVSAILLGTYSFAVRYTWIGAILNGRKHRAPV